MSLANQALLLALALTEEYPSSLLGSESRPRHPPRVFPFGQMQTYTRPIHISVDPGAVVDIGNMCLSSISIAHHGKRISMSQTSLLVGSWSLAQRIATTLGLPSSGRFQ